jgi:hypothetical protein
MTPTVDVRSPRGTLAESRGKRGGKILRRAGWQLLKTMHGILFHARSGIERNNYREVSFGGEGCRGTLDETITLWCGPTVVPQWESSSVMEMDFDQGSGSLVAWIDDRGESGATAGGQEKNFSELLTSLAMERVAWESIVVTWFWGALGSLEKAHSGVMRLI